MVANGLPKTEAAHSARRTKIMITYNFSNFKDAVDKQIFAPLIGSDKIEIINQSKNIETYETSILPSFPNPINKNYICCVSM